MDPFAGSNVTGEVCERLKRRWLAVEIIEEYLEGSKFRFDDFRIGEWIEPNRQVSFYIRDKEEEYGKIKDKKEVEES